MDSWGATPAYGFFIDRGALDISLSPTMLGMYYK